MQCCHDLNKSHTEAGLLNKNSILILIFVTRKNGAISEIDFSHTVDCSATYVRLELDPPQSAEAGLLNKSSRLAPALGLIKFIIVTGMILFTFRCVT